LEPGTLAAAEQDQNRDITPLIEELSMPNRRKVAPGIFIPVFLMFMGIVALSNAASKPSFDAFRAIDVVRLVAVGMCFGAALVTLIMFLRGPRSS
jgi:hypothetical protein